MTRLGLVRVGTFSGSGTSLRDALATKVELDDFDLLEVARRPSMWLARAAAVVEAALARDGVNFSKTAAWSRGLQTRLPPFADNGPVLFVQTTPALDLDPRRRYAIYTDRLGREGLNAEGPFRSRATAGWVAREQRFVEKAHRLFVMGPSTKEYAVSEYGLVPERVVVVGGAPNARLGPHRQSSACRRLLFVGIDWRRKGLPDLLDAFAEIRQEYPHVELDVVGGWPGGPAPEGVTVVGRIPHDQMPRYFSAADLLVIPTYTEPFGIALVEALMMGIPVIGTTVGNQQWIIGQGGLTVEPGDAGALALALRRMVVEYPKMKQAADTRRSELLATMTWDRIADGILSELTDLWEGRP